MNRQIPTSDQALKTMLQTMQDDIDKLNRGAQNAGRVSFGNEIQIGNVLIQVSASGDTVTFTNVQDGKKTVLTLV